MTPAGLGFLSGCVAFPHLHMAAADGMTASALCCSLLLLTAHSLPCPEAGWCFDLAPMALDALDASSV